MLVRFIDGPSKGLTRDVPFITAKTLFARGIAVDERVQPAPPEPVAIEILPPLPKRRPGRKDRSE